MSTNKKSQSIAINTIVIAAIALAVLVVVFVIFTGQTSITVKNIQSCELKGGKCAKNLDSNRGVSDYKQLKCNDKEYNIPLIINDPACGESKLCCLKFG